MRENKGNPRARCTRIKLDAERSVLRALVRRAALLLPVLLITIAPTPANMRIPEHPGSSEKEGREGTSDIFEIHHLLSLPIDPKTGRPNAARVHQPFVVTKVIDRATPGLHKALVTEQNLAKVELLFYRIDPTTQTEANYYTITLTNALVIAIEPYMPMSFVPANESFRHMERVRFAYEQIEWKWIPEDLVETDKWGAPAPG